MISEEQVLKKLLQKVDDDSKIMSMSLALLCKTVSV